MADSGTATALKDGAMFAGYRIVRQVGAGGMGEVYLAQHPRLSRQDAIKILPAELTADGHFAERFRREADLTAALWHPHIVGVHDCGEDEGRLWISMDFVDGTDAARLLAKNPAGLPATDVAAIVQAIADALDFAHEQGLLHRDVKPANILLSTGADRRRILLADFGIGREIAFTGGLTETNMTVGTVNYTAPEQLMGELIDGRADQYALAATAYHLLSGHPVFDNSNPAVVISRHLNATPPQLSNSRPELASLDSTLQRALAKDPADRFPSCTDFAAELRAAHGQSGTARTTLSPPAPNHPSAGTPTSPTAPTQLAPVAARADSTPPVAPDPTERLRVSRLLVVGAAVAVVLVAVVTAATLWPRTDESPGGPTASSPLPTSEPPTGVPTNAAPTTAPGSVRPASPTPQKPPTATAVALTSQYGSTFVITKSGKTACQIRAEAVGCQVDWSVPTPIQCCGPANGVNVTASGDWQWVTGDMGDQSYTTLTYGTQYRTLGWIIAPSSEGTTFTNIATGHGMTVGVQGVRPF